MTSQQSVTNREVLVDGASVYKLSSSRMTFHALICLFGIVVFTAIAFGARTNPGLFILSLLLVLLFGFTLLNLARRLFVSSDLILLPEGIQSPWSFDGTVPWPQITKSRRIKFRRSESLELTIDPPCAATLNWKGLTGRLGRHPNRFRIALSQFSVSADELATAIATRWTVARLAAKQAGLYVSETKQEPPTAIAAPAEPYATYMLILLFAVIYLCEVVFGEGSTKGIDPTVKSLAYLGGDLGYRVKAPPYEIWRMFTAPLMHAGVLHIVLNVIVLWFAGRILERITGWKWLLGIFCLSALGGELASVFFIAPNTVGVGASGGIMGMLAALFFAASRLPDALKTSARLLAMRVLIPSMLPIFTTAAHGEHVNYYAHAGGALVGAILGLALFKFWRREVAKPPLENAMAFLAICYFAVALYAIIPILRLNGFWMPSLW